MFSISNAEKKYIIDGISQDIRNDGRRNNQYRHVEIEANNLQQSHGSSRARFSNGGSDVITSIRAEVCDINEQQTIDDLIEVTCVFTASASTVHTNRIVETEGALIAQSIRKVIVSPGALNYSDFVIIPKLFSWKLSIDIEVYIDNGNLFDIILLSVLTALRTTRLPCTVPVKNFDQEETDFDIDDDPTHFKKLECMSIPLGISMSKVGKSIIVDATEEEEMCIDSLILICVNRRKEIVNIQNLQGRVDVDTLLGSLHVASVVSEQLFILIDKVIERDDMKWTSNEIPTLRGLFV